MGSDRGLVVDSLTVRFGGLVAVDGVSLEAPTGRLTGLIGPNGAGKTTTFNACSGLQRPAAGRIELFGKDVTDLGPPARAQLGLGRTFQRMELFDRMTVAENVAVGREARLAGGRLLGSLIAGRSEHAEIKARTETAITLCGLDQLRDRPASLLSTGQRRLVELARALAGDFAILLLDEPSSGLDPMETEHFGRILQEIVREHGTGILLVEHDMTLVRSVCEYVYVLEFGRLIAQGPTRQVLADEVVRAAYLGSEVA